MGRNKKQKPLNKICKKCRIDKNSEEIYKLCHYTNLRPLWALDNMSKGSKY